MKNLYEIRNDVLNDWLTDLFCEKVSELKAQGYSDQEAKRIVKSVVAKESDRRAIDEL